MGPASPRGLADHRFDVVVVGGGITGAGVARDAADRGLQVALVEAGDFAQATSSASSRLIHGGIRYLQYGDFGLVFEALAERRNLLKVAPHLCRPVEFLFPAYRHDTPGLWSLVAGVNLYNALALWRPPVAGRRLSVGETHALAPNLRGDSLRGAVLYTDCQTDDARLVLENVLDALRLGAVVGSRVRVAGLLSGRGGRVDGVVAEALDLDGRVIDRFEIRARVVVNATGPFSDAFGGASPAGMHGRLLRPTKGVHLVLDSAKLPLAGRAVVIKSPRDGRIMFALPSDRRTVIGTTDTDWSPSGGRAPEVGDVIVATPADVEYLLEAANHSFPDAKLTPDDVVSTYAGLRPLVATKAASASATSREHLLIREPSGVITIVGGKLTTFRRMAEEVVNQLVVCLRDQGYEGDIGPCTTKERPLPGAGSPHRTSDVELAPQVERHLQRTYGSRMAALDVILAEGHPRVRLTSRIDPDLPYLWGEVVFAARHERALDLEDVLVRRLSFSRDSRDGGVGIAPLAAALIGEEHAWSEREQKAAVDRFRAFVNQRETWRRG